MFDVVLFRLSEPDIAGRRAAGTGASDPRVAGDPNQLPPTTFFVSGVDGTNGGDNDSATAGFQSLLNQMLGLLSPWTTQLALPESGRISDRVLE